MSASLNGKTVVVIGGASGVGYAVAEGALAAGAQVVIGSSQSARVDAAAAKLGKGASGDHRRCEGRSLGRRLLRTGWRL